MSRAKVPTDINDKLNFSTENLTAKPDSPLPPSASLVAEEMSFINQVIDFSDPDDIFDVTPSVENLYRNLSNIPSDFDSCTSCSNVQTVTAIVHNVQEREPCELAPISELIVSKPNNFCQDEIESITLMPSPSVSFSSTCPQTEREIDTFSHIDSDYTDTPLSSPANIKRKSQKKKDTGRLRERFQNKWLDNKRKYNLNRGLEYMSRTGKTHEKKEMKAACKCPRKCSEKIEETARYETFKKFWELGDHTRQWDFITKYVSKLEKKRVVTENSQRKCTLRYSIPVSEGSSNIEIVYVCKTMFLNTLSISYNFVKTALDKFDQGLGVETLRQYRDIVNKNFNLSFHIPKKDKCEFCHAFENLQNPTDEQKSKHDWHLAEKDKARQLKEMDKQLSKDDKTLVAVTFDLQKTQNLPHGNKAPTKLIQCLRSNTRTSIQNLTKKFDGLSVAYSSLLPIDKNKFKALQDLCKSNVIPEQYHSYYNNLKVISKNTTGDISE
ncbi:unnamed protein product [Arctia plantaginis]|uniref:Uncharacterized protein n=1 Tax=Arctia plantaginis TaxID=874455 RepID=A0A8S1A084_ARCPL|nr:unnamed protein product [Arctia plantaginis]